MRFLSLKVSSVSFLTILMCTNIALLQDVGAIQENFRWTGPWVDKLVFEVIQDDTQQVLALIDGDVDIIGGQLDPAFLDQLYDAEDVEVSEILRFGYGITEINCKKYPMNITNFRRALAFAMDKNRIIEEGWLGLSELLDCHIPRQHPASIEEDMLYHYYDENISEGTRLLAKAGFEDSDEDGWLEGPGPDGPGTVELGTIVVEGHPTTQIDIFVDVVVQALLELNINAEARQTNFQDYGYPFRYFNDFDIKFHGVNWNSLDLDFYARDMSTNFINTPLYNTPNWSNATWDMYADIVLHSTDYDEIIEAVKKMEEVWVCSCPAIVMYQNSYFTAYRTDRFEGVTHTILEGAPNFYTNLRIHQKSGNEIGGTYTWANPLDVLSFNHYSINSAYADNVLQMLYDSLVRIAPDGNDISWLCTDFIVLTHDDDESVPEGHTRILVDMVQNTTWSDGTPITADDIAFSLNFMRDNVPVAGAELVDMITCYAMSTYELFCEFDSESYWHWHAISYKSVIPRQIWINYSDAYDEYQPSPSSLNEMIVSGAFLPTDWVQGDFVELKQNPLYFRNPRSLPVTITTETTTTNIDINAPKSLFIPIELPFSNQTLGFIGGLYFSLILILIVDFKRRKRKLRNAEILIKKENWTPYLNELYESTFNSTNRRTQFGD
jgi:ABC-type transport system substrate-binding protein